MDLSSRWLLFDDFSERNKCEKSLVCAEEPQVCAGSGVMYGEPRQGDLLHPDGCGGERGVQQQGCCGIMDDVSLISLITGL